MLSVPTEVSVEQYYDKVVSRAQRHMHCFSLQAAKVIIR